MRKAIEREFSTISLKLTEHLMTEERKRVIDPLVAALAFAIGSRFKRQGRNLKILGGTVFHPPFAAIPAFAHISDAAYQEGTAIAESQLGSVAQPTSYGRTGRDVGADLDRTTQKRVEEMMASGATEAQIRQQFQDWAGDRAAASAEYEVSLAYHSGMQAIARQSGDVEKQWSVHAEACPLCVANAGMGWIPEAAPFDSGDFVPPLHLHCLCSIEYRNSQT